MCRWLQAKGLDLGVVNRNGHSALHKAAVKGQRTVCEWLLAPRSNAASSAALGDDLDATAAAGGGISGGGGLGLAQLRPDSDGNDPSTMARLAGFGALAAFLDTCTEQLQAEAKARDATRAETTGVAAEAAAVDVEGPCAKRVRNTSK